MAIDIYPVPTEQRTYTRHNLFTDSQTLPFKDSVGVNLYQDFSYVRLASENYFGMTTGAEVVLNHAGKLGLFCSYQFPHAQYPPAQDLTATSTIFYIGNYTYCGFSLAYVPLSEHIFHPVFSVDLGLGSIHASKTTGVKVHETYYMIYVIKPEIALEMNLLSFLQWTFGVHYRFQISSFGPSDSSSFNGKASGIEVSTGPVFNLR